jgi:hypothetical protein
VSHLFEPNREVQLLLPAAPCNTLAVDPTTELLLGGTRHGSIVRWSLTSLEVEGEVSNHAHLV